MLRKICHWIFGLCILGGFLFVIGAVEASDLNAISANEMLKRGIFGILVISFSLIGLKASGWRYIED